jgi:hypothetical protein
MHVLLLLANSHAFRLRTHYFNRLLAVPELLQTVRGLRLIEVVAKKHSTQVA